MLRKHNLKKNFVLSIISMGVLFVPVYAYAADLIYNNVPTDTGHINIPMDVISPNVSTPAVHTSPYLFDYGNFTRVAQNNIVSTKNNVERKNISSGVASSIVTNNIINIDSNGYNKTEYISGGAAFITFSYEVSPGDSDLLKVQNNTVNIVSDNTDGLKYVYGGIVHNTKKLRIIDSYGEMSLLDSLFTDESKISNNIVNIYSNVNNNSLHLYGGCIDNYELICDRNKPAETFATADIPNYDIGEEYITVIVGDIVNNYTAVKNNNTLNVYSTDNVLSSIAGFENINFYIPGSVKDGSVIIKLVGNDKTDLADTKINAGIRADTVLSNAKKITLIENNNGIKTDGIRYGKLLSGVSVEYNVEISAEEQISQGLYKKLVGKIDGGKAIAKSKSFVETQSANMALLNSGSDMMVQKCFDNAAGEIKKNKKSLNAVNELVPFAAVSVGKARVNSGSYVDAKHTSFGLGFAKELVCDDGKLLFGPLVEYVSGKYESYLDDGTHAEGNNKSWGIGLIARKDAQDKFYYEGSIKAGRITSDYKSKDFSIPVAYDLATSYYGGHLGIGRIHNLNSNSSFDSYFKLIYNHLNGSDIVLKTGEEYNFDGTDSVRSIAGIRYTQDITVRDTFFAGLSWQHEFAGISRASVFANSNRCSTPSPSIQGDTGILELGWKNNSADDKFNISFAVQGYIGRNEGVSFDCQLGWKI